MSWVRLLKYLPSGVMEETALVIRDGELLTIDRHISAGDTITVQSVVSVG